MTDGEPDEICDSENFEILLRLSRTESVPSFEPLGIEWLPLFLADYQGIAKSKDNIDGLYTAMEQLLCYPAEGGIWESEIFPARLHPYDPSWLDTLMQEEDLLWVGSEGHHVTFCFESDLDLLQEDSSEEMELPPGEDDRAESGILQPGAGLWSICFRMRRVATIFQRCFGFLRGVMRSWPGDSGMKFGRVG